jgi:protein-S-isoprenylcysteine O-methyltransferase Ste14
MTTISLQTLALLLLNFIYIGLLPKIFFRRDGKFNLMWWITGSPLLVSAMALLFSFLGLLPLENLIVLPLWISVVAVALSAVSIGLISYTIGTHRVPLSLWHQNNDAPVHIVTWGAYKKVRHPFYTSFLLAQIAAFLLLPHLVTLIGLIWSFAVLSVTAAREERNLSASQFGQDYQAYMAQTGRFFPKLKA